MVPGYLNSPGKIVQGGIKILHSACIEETETDGDRIFQTGTVCNGIATSLSHAHSTEPALGIANKTFLRLC